MRGPVTVLPRGPDFHSVGLTPEVVLRSNSECSMLMSDDLRLPRQGLESRPSGFREVGSIELCNIVTD